MSKKFDGQIFGDAISLNAHLLLEFKKNHRPRHENNLSRRTTGLRFTSPYPIPFFTISHSISLFQVFETMGSRSGVTGTQIDHMKSQDYSVSFLKSHDFESG
jgi:hypothetical protein